MQNIFIVAFVISVVFFLLKFMEMRWVEQESKPLKTLVKETIVVYFSVLVGLFITNQLNQIVEISHQKPLVFTTEPNF